MGAVFLVFPVDTDRIGRDRPLLIQEQAGAEGATAPETLRQKDRVI
jgi:hypothetical protein